VLDLKEVTLVGQAAERFLANRWRAVMMGVNVPIAEVPGHG
jgi:hypothetical protein